MKPGLIGLIILIGMVLSLGGCAMSTYNGIIQADESSDEAWANVETVLQRRYDLVPNLVNTVKGFAEHEKELLTEVTRLRSQWSEAQATGDQAGSRKAAGLLEGALGRLMVVVEKYPDLKSNQNFLALQAELAGTENRISVERRRFNQAVTVYNRSIRRIPGKFFADAMGMEKKERFEAVAQAKEAPAVKF